MVNTPEIRIISKADEGESLSIKPSFFNSLKNSKNVIDAVANAIIKIEGLSFNSYLDGPNGAKTIGYGFNIYSYDAEKIYNNAVKAYGNNQDKDKPPAFSQLHNKPISEGFAKILLKETIKSKKTSLDNILTNPKYGINLDINSIPKDFYMGLLIEIYHNNSRFLTRNLSGEISAQPDFKSKILALNKSNWSEKDRQSFADNYSTFLSSSRPNDGYKFSNRAISIGMFYSGKSDYQMSNSAVLGFVNNAINNKVPTISISYGNISLKNDLLKNPECKGKVKISSGEGKFGLIEDLENIENLCFEYIPNESFPAPPNIKKSENEISI